MSVKGKEKVEGKKRARHPGFPFPQEVNPGCCVYTYGWRLASERRSEEVKAWKII